MTRRVFQRIQSLIRFSHLYEIDEYAIALWSVREPVTGVGYAIMYLDTGDVVYSGVYVTVERSDTFAVLHYLTHEYLETSTGSLVEVFYEDCAPCRKHRRRFWDIGESVYWDKTKDMRGDEFGI